ncbi:unnamed protein product [Onchocerca flexuosa]|uniref:Uncharacterized protein n=1 Tax=Onchocerca flexuosa TaxID=387005 RepID=A0A183I709_9BILA|nr:unnamed protein product [Onchocerca flexuosa]
MLSVQVSGESSLSSPPPPATPPPPPGIPYSVAVGLGTKSTKGSIVQTSEHILVQYVLNICMRPLFTNGAIKVHEERVFHFSLRIFIKHLE